MAAVLKAAYEANTREDFEKYIAEQHDITRESPEYDTIMDAWAALKRDREGF